MPRKSTVALATESLHVRLPRQKRYVKLAEFLDQLDGGERSVWIREACLEKLDESASLREIERILTEISMKLDSVPVEKPKEELPTGQRKLDPKKLRGMTGAL